MRQRLILLIAFFYPIFGSMSVLADPPPSGTSPPVGDGGVLRTFESDSYTLRTGDKVEIFINALPELPSVYEVRVDGSFYHPVAGQIQAAGKTLGQIRAEIKKSLSKELRYPEFRAGLQTISTMTISVIGEAKSQGSFQVGVGGTVLDAIAKAGGLTEKADRKSALILRGNEKIEVLLDPSSGEGLTALKPGDVLFVRSGMQVSVAGEVSNPGAYTVSQGEGAPWDAIIAAGGAKEEAALTRVKLIRPAFTDPLVLDLSPGQQSELPEEARQLQAGDIIVVPARQAAVLGAVTKPGPTPLAKEVSLLELLSEKLTAESDIKRVIVVRAEDVQKNRDKQEEYNLNEYFKEGKGQIGAVPIRDGDLVYVPPKSKGNALFGNGFNILSLLSIARLFF